LKQTYARLLTQRNVPTHSHNYYFKWLRFYLDFCSKYHHAPNPRTSLPLFLAKLQEKRQTPREQKQESHAITLYYALFNGNSVHNKAKLSTIHSKNTAQKPAAALTPEKTAWEKIYADLDAAIKVRHYSPKTYKTYAGWTRKLQHFTKEKAPQSLTVDDVKSFLTHLAVKRKVAASTRNQAFNALLSLQAHFKHRHQG
jgi:hypothetical protein